METVKCPICDNPGIPDYHKQNVTCPHCGSDLSIYKTIQEASQSSKKEPSGVCAKTKIVFSAAIISICLIAVGSYTAYTISRKPLLTQIESQNREIESLNETLRLAQAQVQDNEAKPETTTFIYKIQKNDSPWSIVRKLFGISSNWKAIAQKIAEDNGIWDSEKNTWKEIHPGQNLTIYNIN